ncbi:MAG: hypothetical protein PHS33_08065 [Candidatus Omnitrophica bacterium]|nr:hypothetical protein [Candidatus Omnitrophota bacterium]MDD5264699.1 hypothetical protein [Candidatus Bipolaricaulis sp.]
MKWDLDYQRILRKQVAAGILNIKIKGGEKNGKEKRRSRGSKS